MAQSSNSSSAVNAARSESLPSISDDLKPGVSFSTRNPRIAPALSELSVGRLTLWVDAGFALDLGPHDRHIGDGAVANPLLRSAETITVGGLACTAAQTAGIRAEVGFREGKTTELRALRHRRQPAVFLFFRAEQIDRHHGERALHGGERAQSAVATFELLHHQPGGDAPEPGTAVAFDARSEDTELGQLRHELHRERCQSR